jgi:hypothetical protein
MANISDARGTIVLDGDWTKEQIKDILYVLYSQDTHYDYTLRIEPAKIQDHIDNLYNGTGLSFNGSGRWSFTNNLESFNGWTDLLENHYKSTLLHTMGVDYNDYIHIRKRVMQAMVRHKLSVSFYYADIETGMDMAYKIDVSIRAQYSYNTVDKTDSIDFVTHVGTEEGYECNMRFMCEEILNEDDALYEFLDALIKKKGIKNVDIIKLGRIIKKDEEWMHIPAYPDVDNDEQNVDVLTIVDTLVKETA